MDKLVKRLLDKLKTFVGKHYRLFAEDCGFKTLFAGYLQKTVVLFVANVVLRPLLFTLNVVSKSPCLQFEALLFTVHYT